MPSTAVQNPAPVVESKSAKKKKAKVERTESPAPSPSPALDNKATSTCGADNPEDSSESPYIRELQKYVAMFPIRIISVVSPGLTMEWLGTFAMSTRKSYVMLF